MRERRLLRLAAAALAVPLVAVMLVATPAAAAAPSTPAAPSLTPAGGQLTATWTAPSNGGKAIDDYDVRWRKTTESNWKGHPEGGYHKSPFGFGSGNGRDEIRSDDPLDLGTIGLSTFTREAVSGRNGVYKVGATFDSIRIKYRNKSTINTTGWATVPSLTLRAASSKPTASNLSTHGTALQSRNPGKVAAAVWSFDHITSRLTSGSYFWFVSSGQMHHAWRELELSNIDPASTSTTKVITGLTDATAYEVQVRAGNADGESAWSPSATATVGSAPDTPAAPTVDSLNTSLDVSWTAPTANDPGGITDYDVRYSTSGSSTWTEWNANTTSTTLSATITGLTNGTTYDVQVRAANAIGESEWSPSTSTEPGLPDPPAAPTVTPYIYSMAVSWTAPATNGTAINDYDVRYSSDAGATWTEWQSSTTSTATSATITGLTRDTAYLVQVRAASSAGDGPWSPSTSTRTRVRTPSAPAAPTVVSGNRTLSASWSAPAANDFTILDYDVRYCSSGCTTDSNWTELLDVETSDPGVNATDDTNGPSGDPLDLFPLGFSSVTVTREQASNSNWGLYKLGSNVAGLRVKVTGEQWIPTDNKPTIRARHAASKPTNLTTEGTQIWEVNAPGGGVGNFSKDGWSLPLVANSYFWVASDYYSKVDDADGYFQIRVTSTATSRNIGGLTNGTSYQVQVRAANVKGYSRWSPSTTIVAGLPAAVAAPDLEAGGEALRANWTAPSGNGSAITDYDVEYRQGSTGSWTDVSHTGLSRTATILSLTDGQSYQVRVRSSNTHGAGPWSSPASVTVGVPSPPLAPTLTSGDGSLTATWTAPSGNGSAITDYDVRYRTASSSTWTSVTHAGTDTSASIGTLTNATAYDVQVRATNARGTGAWSPSATDKPGRPQQAAAPTLTTPAQRQIHASWAATTANGSAVTDYDVGYRLASADTWSSWSHNGTGRTATITGLTPSSSYQVRVRASSAAGPGAWSGATSITTSTSAPEPPDAPSLSAGATSLVVTWEAPRNNGAAISGYGVRYRRSGTNAWTTWAHSGTATTATITGLSANATYQVQVSATNSVGTSAHSVIATAQTGAPAAVGTPTLTPAVGQLAVTWTAPASNGAAIDDYDVRYRRVGTSSWTVYDGGSHSTSNTFNTPDTVDGPAGDPLDNGTVPLAAITRESIGTGVNEKHGVYKVNSKIDQLNFHFSAQEDTSTATTLELRHSTSKPTASNLDTLGAVLASATHPGTGNQAVTISTVVGPLAANSYFWLESSASMSLGFRVFRLNVDLATTATSRTLTGLPNGASYEVQVRAGNSRGDGSWSPVATATMPTSPATPEAPSLTPADKSLGVDWSAPTANGSPITDFDLRYSPDSGTTWTEWKAGTTSTSTSGHITGLINGTDYQVQVRAGNAVGDGPWSPSATASPRAATASSVAPGLPGNITAVRTSGSAAVSWSSPGTPYLKYQVSYREVTSDTWNPNPSYPASGWTSVMGTTSATSVTINTWDDTKAYVVAVRARSQVSGRYGGWGVSGPLMPAGTPPRVSDIEVTRPSASQLNVTWDQLAGYSAVTNYDVAWSEDTSPRNWQNQLNPIACNGTTCTRVYVVNPAKGYAVRVRSVGTGNKTSQWVVHSPSYALDIENLSSERVLAGTDPAYVELRPLDVVVTWDALPSSTNVSSYQVLLFDRVGSPSSYYDSTDDNNTVGAKPDNWNMDWHWYSLCNDGNASTNPPGSRGCTDPFHGTTPYRKPVWDFGAPAWGPPQTVAASACDSVKKTCTHTFADSTVGGLSTKVQVWAVDSASKHGPRSTHTTHPARPPFPPLWTKAVAPSGASVQVRWLEGYDNGSPITGFDVKLFRLNETTRQYHIEDEVVRTKGTPLPDANRGPRDNPVLTYTFHNVTTNSQYYAAVRAHNIEGSSNWRVLRKNLTLAPTKPPPPAPPTVAISGTTATVTWMAPADDGGSTVTGYLVRYRKKNVSDIWPGTWTSHAYSGAVCSGTTACRSTVTVAAGSAVGDYQFQVAATNSITAGSDQYSSVGSPDAPTGVTATAIASGVSVAWTQPADIGTSPILAADIRTRVSSPQGTWSAAQTPSTNAATSPAVITGLTANTAYDVQIRVRNANGPSPWVGAGTISPS